jgi:hypothetical protein
MTSASAKAVVEDAKAYFVGVEIFDERYVGDDIVLHDDGAVLLVRDLQRHEVIGVRFPVPLLLLRGSLTGAFGCARPEIGSST